MQAETDTAEVNALLDAIVAAQRARDVAALTAAVSEARDTVLIGSEAGELVVGGEGWRGLLAAQMGAVEAFEMPIRERWVRRLGDVAWFAAIVDVRMTIGGQAIELTGLRQTGVAVREGGTWRLVQSHLSIGTPPAA